MAYRISLSARILIALAITLTLATVLFFASYNTLYEVSMRWILEAPDRSELEFWSYLWLPLLILFGVLFTIILTTINVLTGNLLGWLFDAPASVATPIDESAEDTALDGYLRYAPLRGIVRRRDDDLPDAREMSPPPRYNSYAPNADRRVVAATSSRERIIPTDIIPEASKEPSYLRKREDETFSGDFAFAEYVARLITDTGKYKAMPRGDIIQLVRNGQFVGICKAVLIDESDYVPVAIIERLAQQRIPDTSVLMLATTGRFERATRQEAKRLEVRLLDGHDLQQIKAVLKRRA